MVESEAWLCFLDSLSKTVKKEGRKKKERRKRKKEPQGEERKSDGKGNQKEVWKMVRWTKDKEAPDTQEERKQKEKKKKRKGDEQERKLPSILRFRKPYPRKCAFRKAQHLNHGRSEKGFSYTYNIKKGKEKKRRHHVEGPIRLSSFGFLAFSFSLFTTQLKVVSSKQ